MKIFVITIVFLSFIRNSFSQVPRTQYGGYFGIGTSKSGSQSQSGLAYEIGQSLIIKKKGDKIRRKELFIQFAENNYHRDSRVSLPNSYKYDTTYALSDYRIQFLQFGVKWQLPIVHREKFRLLISPGVFFGSVLSYNYTRSWYYFSDNSLDREVESTGFLLTRIIWGTSIGLQNEIQLKPRLYLHVDLNLLSQSTFEYESSGPWSSFVFRSGIYFYLNPKNPIQ
jgi:hypothetical protein